MDKGLDMTGDSSYRGQEKAGQDRTRQDRTAQDRTRQGRTGQVRTGRDGKGQDMTKKGQDRITDMGLDAAPQVAVGRYPI